MTSTRALKQNSFFCPLLRDQSTNDEDHVFQHSWLPPALSQPAENTVHVQLPRANSDVLKRKDPVSINVRRLFSFFYRKLFAVTLAIRMSPTFPTS
jgi:hypothetical protein